MELFEVVEKLTGPVMPIGDSGVDGARLNNLIAMIDVVDSLLVEIKNVAQEKGSHMSSMDIAGEAADKFLKSWGIEE